MGGKIHRFGWNPSWEVVQQVFQTKLVSPFFSKWKNEFFLPFWKKSGFAKMHAFISKKVGATWNQDRILKPFKVAEKDVVATSKSSGSKKKKDFVNNEP